MASDGDLKRVGLQFTADGAVDFKNSLKGVQSALKETNAEFKLAKSTYDENTSSTQKLADRQKYLQGVTEAYGDKVKILQEQLKDMQNAEEQDTNAINKKSAELKEAQAKLNGYQKSLEEVNKALKNHAGQLKDAGDTLTNMSKTTGSIGNALTKNVTAPIAGIATASVAAFSQVDAGMDTIVTKTGATGEALESMQNIAKDIATTIPVSFEDAGAAVGEVNTRFGATGDQLQELSTEFLKFAEINGTDVSSSVDSVQKAMAAFGNSADDTQSVLGVLTSVGQASGISIDTLTSDLTANATAFQDMGLNISDAAGILSDFELSGVDVSEAMKGLKKAQIEAADSGQSMSDVLQRAFSSSGDAVDIFGSKIGVQLYDAVQNGTVSVEDFCTGSDTNLSDFASTVDDTFAATEDPIDKFKTALNKLELIGANIIETSGPLIEQVADTVLDVLTRVSDAWNGLSPGMQNFIIHAALVAAATGPMISVVSTVTGKMGDLFTGLSKVADGSKTFSSLLSGIGGPVGLAITAIAALIPLFVDLYNNNEAFRNVVDTVWNAILAVIQTVIGFIQALWENVLKPVFTEIGDFCQNILFPIIQVVFMAIYEVISTVFSLIHGIWENILLPVFTAIGDFLQGTLGPIFDAIFNGIGTVVSTIFSAISDFWNGILLPVFTAIGDFLTGTLGPVFDTIFGAISDVVSTVFGAISDFWSGILEPVFSAIGDALGVMWDVWQDTLGWVFDKVQEVFGGIEDFLSPVIDWLKGIFDFDWHLPSIKLPHFSIDGSFSLNPPSVPHFNIDWYARAMENAVVLSSPTIFGSSGGSLLGGGEAGNEVIAGESHLMDMIRAASASGGMSKADLQDVITRAVAAALKLAKFSVEMDGDKMGEFISDYLRREVFA